MRASEIAGTWEGLGTLGKRSQSDEQANLQYSDENGRILSPKEAFRKMSWKFHGKVPKKLKVEDEERQKIVDLISLQHADGSWSFSDILQFMESYKISAELDENVKATLLAIFILETDVTYKVLWELVVAKARKWLLQKMDENRVMYLFQQITK